MKQIITTLIFTFSTLVCFGQKIEPHFMDHFKNSKWKSLDDFNDSTILNMKEIRLTRWNPEMDSLKFYPILWIYDNEFKIKYYYNTMDTSDSTGTKTKTSFNVMNCAYSYKEGKRELTITLDDKDKSTLTFNAGIISTGSVIFLWRKK